jgi:hypothetical protein
MPRHHVEGSKFLRILRDEMGVHISILIFSRTLFNQKDKFEVKMTCNIFKRLFLLKTQTEFLICINQFFNYSVIVLTLLATCSGTMWKGASCWESLETRGLFIFLMVIFLATIFSQKDKFEIKVTNNIFKRLSLLKTEIEFLICINQFLTIQWLSSPCWLHAEAPCGREHMVS